MCRVEGQSQADREGPTQVGRGSPGGREAPGERSAQSRVRCLKRGKVDTEASPGQVGEGTSVLGLRRGEDGAENISVPGSLVELMGRL